MTRIMLIALLCALPGLAAAQGADGSNRPSNWRVKYFEAHGIWETMCDERDEAGALRQRCYIRNVDVFSPAPQFAAQFVFITPEDDGPQVDFGMEPGTLFASDGFHITRDEAVSWQTRRPGCLTGLSCTFLGPEATALIEEMKSGDAFRFTFVDRHGSAQNLTWSLEGFAEAFEAFTAQARARGLM